MDLCIELTLGYFRFWHAASVIWMLIESETTRIQEALPSRTLICSRPYKLPLMLYVSVILLDMLYTVSFARSKAIFIHGMYGILIIVYIIL